MNSMHGPLGRYLPRLFTRLAASGTTDRCLLQVLLARAHIDRAWKERGGGWAPEVKPEGWEGFGKHIAKARSLLLQAWQEHPELPEPAHFLIMVTPAACPSNSATTSRSMQISIEAVEDLAPMSD